MYRIASFFAMFGLMLFVTAIGLQLVFVMCQLFVFFVIWSKPVELIFFSWIWVRFAIIFSVIVGILFAFSKEGGDLADDFEKWVETKNVS